MSKPYWKLRASLRMQRGLERVGILPSGERAVRLPVEKRMAVKPASFMLGPVPDVPWSDELLTTRDGSSIRLRVYRPAGATAPILYAHGGGFIFGGIDSADHICKQVAHEAGRIVVSVEYRLAPEHPFPGPLQDCEDALAWLRQQDWESDLAIVAGDSAGGNLAAALAIKCRDEAIPLAGQVLLYPALDMTADGEGVRTYRGLGLSSREIRICAATHLGGADPRDPLASPLHAADLSGLAPAFVLTVEHDALRWEGEQYVARLRAAGVHVEHLDVPGFVHGSLSAPALHQHGVSEVYASVIAFISARQGSGDPALPAPDGRDEAL